MADCLWERYQSLNSWIGGAGRHQLDVPKVCKDEIADLKVVNRLMRRLDRFEVVSKHNHKGGEARAYHIALMERFSLGPKGEPGKITHRNVPEPQFEVRNEMGLHRRSYRR